MQMDAHDKELRDFLIDSGLVPRSHFASLTGAEGKPLAVLLVEKGIIGADDVRRAVASVRGIPFITLSTENISTDALLLIPEPLARAHNMAAFALTEQGLEVAVLDTDSLEALAPLALIYRVLPRMTDQASVRKALLLQQKRLKEKFSGMTEAGEEAVGSLLRHALYSRATEVHIDHASSGILVRYRIGPHLHEALRLPAHSLIPQKIKTAAKLLADSAQPQEGSFVFEHGGEHIAAHVITVPGEKNERLTMHVRTTNSQGGEFVLESLGFHGESLARMHDALVHTSGLILVAAPTGNGVTTLLYTLLGMLNSPHRSLITIEEKVERHFTHVTQVTVGGARLTTASALRSALKQNPDVLMIGNIADEQTALLALEAANRGTLVLAGIEASSAAHGIERLQQMGVSVLSLRAALRASVSVRLLKRLCENHDITNMSRAKEEVFEGKANFGRVLTALKNEHAASSSAQWKDLPFGKALPCEKCIEGYKGKIGVQEVLTYSKSIGELISQGVSREELETYARTEHMLTLVEDALYKAALSYTSIEEASQMV